MRRDPLEPVPRPLPHRLHVHLLRLRRVEARFGAAGGVEVAGEGRANGDHDETGDDDNDDDGGGGQCSHL